MSLPDGWIQEYDSNHNHPYWVDTRSNPPRAIWVHPYEDEQFLAEERAREDVSNGSNLDAPPSYDAVTEGRASDGISKAKASTPHPESDPPNATAGPSSQREHKRGIFGRLKDKAIGTKEEREEQRRIRAEQAEERARQARIREQREREERRRVRAEQAAQAEERARRARMREQREREERRRIRAAQTAQAEEWARQARMQELQEREAYMRAYGGYAPYHPSSSGYGPGATQTAGLGGGNTAALLLGGLAGGLLLGDIFGGGLGF